MQALGQQLGLVVEDLVERRLGHADRDLRIVDEHGVIPADPQTLAVLDAAAGRQLEGGAGRSGHAVGAVIAGRSSGA